MTSAPLALLLAIPLLLAAGASVAAEPDPLAARRGMNRVLVASAPDPADPALRRQRELFAAMARGAGARDLVLVEAVGEGAQPRAIRAALHLPETGFAAALVGKDGGVKLRAARPLDANALFPLIDAMPMRREERRARGE